MSNLASVLLLNNEQVEILLSNHELFSADEIKIAAKLRVKHEKMLDFEHRRMLHEIMRGESGKIWKY